MRDGRSHNRRREPRDARRALHLEDVETAAVSAEQAAIAQLQAVQRAVELAKEGTLDALRQARALLDEWV